MIALRISRGRSLEQQMKADDASRSADPGPAGRTIHGYSARDRDPDAGPRPPRWSLETGRLSVPRSVTDAPGDPRCVCGTAYPHCMPGPERWEWPLRPEIGRAMVGRTGAPLRDRRTRCLAAPAARGC